MQISERVRLVGSGELGFLTSHPLDCNVFLLDGGHTGPTRQRAVRGSGRPAQHSVRGSLTDRLLLRMHRKRRAILAYLAQGAQIGAGFTTVRGSEEPCSPNRGLRDGPAGRR
jgi:hypothetical protein